MNVGLLIIHNQDDFEVPVRRFCRSGLVELRDNIVKAIKETHDEFMEVELKKLEDQIRSEA